MRAICSIVAGAAAMGWAGAFAADLRMVSVGDTQVTILDAGGIEPTGDWRTASFYTATSEASIYSLTRLEFDCPNRLVRPESMVGIDPMTGKLGKERVMDGTWTKADRTVSDSRTMKLVCSTPEERDRYGRRLPETDWRSALKAAFAPLRGGFALAFDLPVGGTALVCSGGTVARPASLPPVTTNGPFRTEVDPGRRTILFRDALGPGIASDFAITAETDGGLGIAKSASTSVTADGWLDFRTKTLRLKGQRDDADGGGSFAVELQCMAANPLP